MNDAQKYIIFVECEMGNMRSYFLLSFQDTKFYEHNKKKKKTFTSLTNNNGEESLRRAEEEEEEGEGRGCRTSESEYGAAEAWTDEVVDRVGVAS
jgi:hypothetical protein